MRSLLVTSASTRPLYWAFEEVVVLEVIKFAMSATPSRPPPTPGVVGLTQPRSCVPKAVFKGEPISRPWPGIVLQFTPSVRPAVAQVEGLIPWLTTPEPGKERYFAAMLPAGAEAAKDEVSYHPLPTLLELGSSSLIVKEEEDLILPDRAADVA